MTPQELTAVFQYEWEPFNLDGSHPTFAEFATARLDRGKISHWGPAIFKWEGLAGPKAGTMYGTAFGEMRPGNRAFPIDETSDLRQSIKQYVFGTEGEFYRDQFLNYVEARLFVLNLQSFSVAGRQPLSVLDILRTTSLRAMLRHLLVLRAIRLTPQVVWLTNRMTTAACLNLFRKSCE